VETVGVLFIVSGVWVTYCGLFGLQPGVLALAVVRDPAHASTLIAQARAAAIANLKGMAAVNDSSTASGVSPGTMQKGANPGTSAAQAQAYAQSRMSAYGWGSPAEWSALQALWTRESGWNYQATNASSGAYGIPQALPASKMSSAGSDWKTNPATQIEWGLAYIKGRYGSPSAAWTHEQSSGWY